MATQYECHPKMLKRSKSDLSQSLLGSVDLPKLRGPMCYTIHTKLWLYLLLLPVLRRNSVSQWSDPNPGMLLLLHCIQRPKSRAQGVEANAKPKSHIHFQKVSTGKSFRALGGVVRRVTTSFLYILTKSVLAFPLPVFGSVFTHIYTSTKNGNISFGCKTKIFTFTTNCYIKLYWHLKLKTYFMDLKCKITSIKLHMHKIPDPARGQI